MSCFNLTMLQFSTVYFSTQHHYHQPFLNAPGKKTIDLMLHRSFNIMNCFDVTMLQCFNSSLFNTGLISSIFLAGSKEEKMPFDASSFIQHNELFRCNSLAVILQFTFQQSIIVINLLLIFQGSKQLI